MSTHHVLFGDALRSSAQPWLDELGKSDRDRLLVLFDLAIDEKTRLSDCLTKLYPGTETTRALADLTRLRKRLNDAADGDGDSKPDLGFRFHVDTKKKNPPTERFVWFTGPDAAVMRVTSFSEDVTRDIEGKPFVPSKGIATSSSALAAGKRVVRFFVSYAHEDKTLAEAVVKGLRAQFAPSKRYELDLWIDHEIMVGEKWHARILQAITDCDFGLFMVSPDFLGSRYIGDNEIPPFVSSSKCKPVVPVGLVPVSFGRHDLKGLQESQIFFLRGRSPEGRCFDQMRAAADKRDFIHQLYLDIEKRLDAHFSSEGCLLPVPRVNIRAEKSEPTGKDVAEINECLSIEDAARMVPTPEATKHFQRTKGVAHHLGDRESVDPAKLTAGESRDALDELDDWACRSDGSPFFALLGEVGIGKTTTLKQLTRQLLEKRQTDPAKHPLPIYIDLRDYVGDQPGAVPTIEELLTSVIQRSWRLRDKKVAAADILRLVREEGAVIIFDGLDEKIVHLTPSRARDFIRTLWSVLPDAMLPSAKRDTAKRMGRLIISCRSHYFRDVWSQNAMLTGEDRESLDRQQYPAFCLLPFTEEQIRSYLADFIGDVDRAEAAFTLIASIHNLRDLAERPYLLSLISNHLGELEALQMRGETVNAARLYDLVVRSWLNRDDGKHQIDPAHKRRLMEELAAALWHSGEKQWNVDRLEDWLDDFLLANPAIREAYANKDRSLLKEDLRTATFVLRPDSEEQSFRFAHTSLQEYFLACHLARALRDKNDTAFDLPETSLETLDFLGQILATETHRTDCLASLERIIGGECLRAACLAFQYWLEAIKHGHPEPQPKQVNLAGAVSQDWEIKGHSAQRPLNLRGANLRGIKLNRTRVQFVDATGADLTGMEARQALFNEVLAERTNLEGADMAGAYWRGGSLREANLTSEQVSKIFFSGLVTGRSSNLQTKPDSAKLISFVGHQEGVLSCAISPCGTRLASASEGSVLRIWSMETGMLLHKLVGHQGGVWSCAWNPRANLIASSGSDKVARIWNATTGQLVKELHGHGDSINWCEWSPDGRMLLTASGDRTLRVWDAANGAELLQLNGHTDSVNSCDWSPCGKLILSCGSDGKAMIWNAKDGRLKSQHKVCAQTLGSCDWHPCEQRFLVTSVTGTISIWEVATDSPKQSWSTECNLFLCRAKWSPNGEFILSTYRNSDLAVWNPQDGNLSQHISHQRLLIGTCGWTHDGKSVVFGGYDFCLHLWDLAENRELLCFRGEDLTNWSCDWSRDGATIAIGRSESVGIWDSQSRSFVHHLLSPDGFAGSSKFDRSGDRVLTSSCEGRTRVFDVRTGDEICSASPLSRRESWGGWTNDEHRAVTVTEDGRLEEWEVPTGKRISLCQLGVQTVRAIDFSPDGKLLLLALDHERIRVLMLGSLEHMLEIKCGIGELRTCRWSSDSSRILVGGRKGVEAWDSNGTKLFQIHYEEDSVFTTAWSPAGETFVVGCRDGSATIRHSKTGSLIHVLTGHLDVVSACAWSPEGDSVLTVCFDGSFNIWDTSTGECRWMGLHLPEANVAAISGDRQQVLSASPEAWRWLGWQTFDAEGRILQRLPLEAFGPIPGLD